MMRNPPMDDVEIESHETEKLLNDSDMISLFATD